ncbi:TetR/AcrR family transcriptional regulator [Furfurilactobacillus siliginis]|uniref:TetR family transcriptional regulator n=1 Tax=Furfurilactobacillus siliginis TaxID=348151 RepID=A0A0R2LDB7_9LACO|nr:TetR/AcrR family transcriptional regulator [Furfurilactobacillus siliginis]KRN96621.1 hypothetical protein IV55_GL001144 [Furfurilactobacillus siliginis]GEK29382.1 TetR family transcriptional regulator [Furfurilactobacillus siliginis]
MKKKDEQKYERILDETAKLILEGSVGAVSTTMIAHQVGISQSSIYVYFKNREALLLALYIRELEKLYQGDASLPVAELDFPQQLQAYIRQLFEFAMVNPESMTVIQKIKGDVAFDEEAQTQIEQIIQSSPVQQLLFQGIADGTLRPVDISLHRNVIFSTIKLHTDNLHNGVYTEVNVPFEQVSEMVISAVLNAK